MYNFIGGFMWLDRLEKILNSDCIQLLKNKTVLIIGIGGVGGSALESIVRMGINNVIIVDNDKVDVARKRVLDINPICNLVTVKKFIDASNYLELFDYNIDYIIDCCDTVSTKMLLIKECLDRNIKIISSMGTGNKFHPEMLEIVELKKTSYDPLAKVIRNKFKDEKRKIMVVCSKEKGVSIKDRTPGSCSLVPNAAGIMCASFVVNDILKEV